MSRHAIPLMVVGLLWLAACREGQPAAQDLAVSLATPVRLSSVCEGDSLKPSTAAPAEGLWEDDRRAAGRVAVMVGPTRATAGDTRLVRHIETMEVTSRGDTLRRTMDATVRLELLPALPGEALGDPTTTGASGNRPTAAYALDGTVMVAAYEACPTSARAPRLRYLRRDPRGHLVTDLMLHRASGG